MAAKKPKTNPITDPSKFVKEVAKKTYKVVTDPSMAFSKTKPINKAAPKKNGIGNGNKTRHPQSAMGLGSGRKELAGFDASYKYAQKAMQNNAPSSKQGVDKKGRKTNIVGFYGGMQIDAKKKKKK